MLMTHFSPVKALKTFAIGLLGVALNASTARATTIIDDPLHGFCGTSAGSSTCSDNGTITPTSSLGQFGFYISPDDQTGTNWLIAILVPTNIANSSSFSFNVSESAGAGSPTVNAPKSNVAFTHLGTAANPLFDSTDSDLVNFLGATTAYGMTTGNTNPANSYGAFTNLGSSKVFTTITGFDIYLADLGAANLFKSSTSAAPNAPLLTLGGDSLVAGMEIASFLLGTCSDTDHGCNPNIATAPSGVLLYTGSDCVDCGGGGGQAAVPEPATLLLFGSGLGFVARRVRRRKKA